MMLHDLSETPGIVYALAYWSGCILFMKVNRLIVDGLRLKGLQLLFLMIIGAYMTLNDNVPQALFVPSMLLVILMMFVFIYLICDFSLLNVGYYTARAFITGEFVASLSWQLYYYAVNQFDLPSNLGLLFVFIGIFYPLLMGILYWMEKRYREENMKREVSPAEVTYTVIIAVVIFMMSNLSYVTANTPFSVKFIPDIYNVRTLIDFGGVALLFAHHMHIAELNMKFEMERMENLLNLQSANYQMSEKSIEMVNQKYHDLKHQIAVLKTETHSVDSLAYLNALEKEIKGYEAQNKTGNKIMDTVLMGKQIHCQSENINLTAVVDGKALEMMDPIDLATLFGNLLDNAIENVLKIQESERRLIHLAVAEQKQFLRIRIENCYEGELKYRDGLPQTTKADKTNHGYGLKSVKSIVKKYGGSVTIGDENGWFEIRILIPLKNNRRLG